MYPREAVVFVQSFIRRQEGEDIIIGRPETAVFLAVPPEAVEVLDHLARGRTVGETTDLYLQKYGETPDMDDFLSVLERKGIVQPQSGTRDSGGADTVLSGLPARMACHFSNFPRSLAQRIFSRPALAGSLVVTILAAMAVILRPSLRVGPRDLYFPDHRALSWTILTAAAYVSLFIHELAHLVAAKALGINSRIRISHRLWYLVAETDLTALWSVPKQKRYLPLLAGTLLDVVSAALCILVIFVQEENWLRMPLVAIHLLRAMVFAYLARVVWQCFLFVRTDFYYVIANFFNCKNLLGDTEVYLRNQLAKVVRSIRPFDQSAVPESEKRVIRVYAWFWVAGRIAAFLMLIAVTLPVAGRYVKSLAVIFRIGYSADPTGFVDALLLASYFFIPFMVGFTLWVGSMVRRVRT